mmetsp:Transcript_11403/g.13516  ORF Transcript_11403/g.13516 Transcript_11403/m.13516 type:complete len:381 (-) Transcript_11403:312-1454(-)
MAASFQEQLLWLLDDQEKLYQERFLQEKLASGNAFLGLEPEVEAPLRVDALFCSGESELARVQDLTAAAGLGLFSDLDGYRFPKMPAKVFADQLVPPTFQQDFRGGNLFPDKDLLLVPPLPEHDMGMLTDLLPSDSGSSGEELFDQPGFDTVDSAYTGNITSEDDVFSTECEVKPETQLQQLVEPEPQPVLEQPGSACVRSRRSCRARTRKRMFSDYFVDGQEDAEVKVVPKAQKRKPVTTCKPKTAANRAGKSTPETPVDPASYDESSDDSQVMEITTPEQKKPQSAAEKPKDKKCHRRKKDKDAPRKGRSAFILFLMDFRNEHKQENNTAKAFSNLSKRVAAAWANLSEPLRAEYHERAGKEAAEYKRMKVAYLAKNK